MFGFKTAAGLKGLPRGLSHFCAATSNCLGSPEKVLRSRTPYGIYLPLLTDEDARKAVEWTCGAPSEGAPVLSLRAFKARTSFPLRACKQCLEEDRCVLGVGTWRVEHQLPGVSLCPGHGVRLHEQVFEGKRKHENKWQLVDDAKLAVLPASERSMEADAAWWLNYAQICWVLFSHKKISTERLRSALGQALSHQGVVDTSYRFDKERIRCWWEQAKRPDFAQIKGMEQFSASKWLADLQLRRVSNHPVRWAVACTAAMSPAALTGYLSHAPSLQADLDGHWLSTDDTRLDMLSPPVWEMLSSGHDLATVSEYSGKRPQALRHALRMNPTMLRCRVATVAKNELAARRALVQDFFVRNPKAGRAGLAGCLSAELRWLEVHDAAWIADQLRYGERMRGPQRTLFP